VGAVRGGGSRRVGSFAVAFVVVVVVVVVVFVVFVVFVVGSGEEGPSIKEGSFDRRRRPITARRRGIFFVRLWGSNYRVVNREEM